MRLDHDGYLPVYAHLSDGNVHEMVVARSLNFAKGRALIAMLFLKILQFESTFGWALSNLVALVRWNLFTHQDLWEWINRPFDTPPESPPAQRQLFDLDCILPYQN